MTTAADKFSDTFAPINRRYFAEWITRRDRLARARRSAAQATLPALPLGVALTHSQAPLLIVATVICATLAFMAWLGVARLAVNMATLTTRVDRWVSTHAHHASPHERRAFLRRIKPEHSRGSGDVRYVSRDESGRRGGADPLSPRSACLPAAGLLRGSSGPRVPRRPSGSGPRAQPAREAGSAPPSHPRP